MIALILFSLIQATTINYQAGNRYTYDFSSISRMEAMNTESETKSQAFSISASTHFSCLYSDGAEFVFEMTAENVRIAEDGAPQSSLESKIRPDVEAIFARPIVFSLNTLGQIYDVEASPEDTEEVINIKTAMIESIRTAVPLDGAAIIGSAGQYFAHSDEFPTEEGVEINTFYTEADFVHHRDEALDSKDIAINGESIQRVANGIVTESTQRVFVSFSPRAEPTMDTTEVTEQVYMLSNGYTSMTLIETATSNNVFESAEAARRIRTRKPVSYMKPEFYAERETKEVVEVEKYVYNPGCPAGVDLCKTYGIGFWVGNASCGIQLTGSVLAGTNKGCKQPTRNFQVGAYLNIDLWVLDNKLDMVQAYAEYGYISGSAKRNAAEVIVFGYSVVKKTFPDAPCVGKSIQLLNTKKSASVKYTVYVSILPVTFAVGATLSIKVDLPYQYCFSTWEASVAVVPVANVALYAQVSASILLAQGGIRFEANIEEKLDPTAYLSLGQCRVGIKATSYTQPFNAQFLGYVQTRDCGDWCKWGPTKDHVFWKWSAKSITKQLFDLHYQV